MSNFFLENPGDWAEEVARRSADWDLMIPGDQDEDEAYTVLEAFIGDALSKAKHTKGELETKKKAEKLSTEGLYEQMMHNSSQQHAGYNHVYSTDVKRMYQRCQKAGLDEDFAEAHKASGSDGKLPDSEAVDALIDSHSKDDGKIGLSGFKGFVKDLSDASGVDEKMFVSAMEFGVTGGLSIDSTVVEACFKAATKEYRPGRDFTLSDFTIMCRNAGFIKKKGFTQGDAEMIYHAVAKKAKGHKAKHGEKVQQGGADMTCAR